MAEKTDSDRIKEIYKLCKSHFGDVRFVGVKYPYLSTQINGSKIAQHKLKSREYMELRLKKI